VDSVERGIEWTLLSGRLEKFHSSFTLPFFTGMGVGRRKGCWELASGKLLAIFQGHTGAVLNGVFSPDGRRMLTASSDKTAQLWEAQSGKLLSTFQGHTDGVNSAFFSPNGDGSLTAARDSTTRRWEAESGKLLATYRGKIVLNAREETIKIRLVLALLEARSGLPSYFRR
jgi:WD40 repeat protein